MSPKKTSTQAVPEKTADERTTEDAGALPVNSMTGDQPFELDVIHSTCTFEAILNNFTSLLQEADFEQELRALGIGKLWFRQRRRVVASLQALYVALWRLALLRSFPEDADHICNLFLESLRSQSGSRRTYALTDDFEQEVRDYVERLQHHGSANFTDVATYLVSRLKPKEPDDAAARLRLALLIRNAYTTIFAHLV